MDESGTLKKQLRRSCRERSAALTDAYRREADRRIRESLLTWECWKSAKSIFLYVSMWAEPDTRALIAAALAEGKGVFVPLCCPDGAMKAVRIRSLSELRPGTLGIPEPPDGEAAAPGELDLAVVPCAAAGENGARLGRGAGYYDRFLRLHGCRTLCLCYEAMLTEGIPMDRHDVWMDAVLTETALRPGVHRQLSGG